MGSITFTKTQGSIPVQLPGKDHVSGIMIYCDTLPAGFGTDKMKKVVSITEAETLGITSDAVTVQHKVLHYHISEVFRINPGCELYIGIFAVPEAVPEETYDFAELKELQEFAGGDIRQAAVYCPEKSLAAAEVGALQTIATALEAQHMPLSILYAADVSSLASLVDLSSGGRCNVSVVIGEDVGDRVAALATALTQSITCVGTVLGAVSLAKVSESIAWVQKFPMGIDNPGFADGSTYESVSEGTKFGSGSLDEKRFIFLCRYTGIAGCYLNDSHNLDLITSDYNYIERVRTIDKAIRGIRANVLPYLSGPVKLDPDTGKLAPDYVAFLEVTANRALENMAKNDELSGYKVSIDPEQNVLSTSTVEFVVQKVPVGVSRSFAIKIGYTTKIQ